MAQAFDLQSGSIRDDDSRISCLPQKSVAKRLDNCSALTFLQYWNMNLDVTQAIKIERGLSDGKDKT